MIRTIRAKGWKGDTVINGRQLHAARILAGLSVADVAARAGLSADALIALESREAEPLFPGQVNADRAKQALEQAGIVFIESDGAGVRLRPTWFDEGLRPEELSAENDG